VPASPASGDASSAGLTPSGSWPVVPAPGGSAEDETVDETETEATRPLYASSASGSGSDSGVGSGVGSDSGAGETSAGLPSRAARGPAAEERSLLAGPSFDGFAVPSRPGQEEETEAFHPGSQSPAAPRPRHAAGNGEYAAAPGDDSDERRGRFQPMAPQPPVEEATTAFQAPAPSSEDATTALPGDDAAAYGAPAPSGDATTTFRAAPSEDASTAFRTSAPSGDADPTFRPPAPSEDATTAFHAPAPGGDGNPAFQAPAPSGDTGTTFQPPASGADEATTVLRHDSSAVARDMSARESGAGADAATLWPYGGGNDEATARFEAPVDDAEETANFGFGGQTLSPSEAAERRAAFARGEADRRATAAQSQLDRIAAERAATQATGAQPAAGQTGAGDDAEETQTPPRGDNPWAQPPRERG
jgi:hypothetical protein